MGHVKRIKDYMLKILSGQTYVPRGLYDMSQYFRVHGPINFEKRQENGLIVARSTDFLQGTIVTCGEDEAELDGKIKDAILTAFEVPSSYAKEAGLHRVGEESDAYAIA